MTAQETSMPNRLAVPLLMLPLLSTTAFAGTLPAWEMSSFGDREGSVMAGRDGWVNGYEPDPWWGTNDVALTATDDNNGDGGGDRYGSGWAADNWIVRGDRVEQVSVTAVGVNEDDDFLGLVLNHNGSDSFYLVGITSDSAPPPVREVRNTTLYVIRVKDGVGEVMESRRVQERHEMTLKVTHDDDTLIVTYRDVQI